MLISLTPLVTVELDHCLTEYINHLDGPAFADVEVFPSLCFEGTTYFYPLDSAWTHQSRSNGVSNSTRAD
jgi:hypothetical protein